jgi:hypothetical protein
VEALGFAALVGMYIWKCRRRLTAIVVDPGCGWWEARWCDATRRKRWDGGPIIYGRRHGRQFPFVIASLAVCGAGLFMGMLQRCRQHWIEPRRFTGYVLLPVAAGGAEFVLDEPVAGVL